MASLPTHLKSAQGRTTVIGYHFAFETGQTVSVAFNLGCEIIKLMSEANRSMKKKKKEKKTPTCVSFF